MGEEENRWWRNPQGIGAALSILAVGLTFFFVREKRDWEQSARITALEARGDKAIERTEVRLSRAEDSIVLLKDRVTNLEYRLMEHKKIEEP